MLNVLAGPMASLSISPATTSVQVGTPITYSATGADAVGTALGLYTATTTFSLGAGNGTCLLNICTPTKVGNLTVTATNGSVTATATIVVVKKVLTVTAPDVSAVYGGSVSLTPLYSGFLLGDSAATLATAPTCSVNLTSVGTTATVCSGGVDANYSFTYVNGAAVVVAKALTVTAPSSTRVFGSTAAVSLTPTISGFINGDTFTTLPVCTTTTDVYANVGTYPVVCTPGTTGSNYQASAVAGTLTVTPAPLTVRAPTLDMVGGDAIPTLTPTYEGLLNGPVQSAATCATTATNNSSAGSYPVICSGAADSNYAIAYTPGTLTIGAKPTVTVTASSVTRGYGQPNGPLFATYSGVPAGGSLDVMATCLTAAGNNSPVGTYAVTCSGASGGNYTFSYVPGSVTVVPAAVVVQASDYRQPFGTEIPGMTPKYIGLASTDVAPTTEATCTTTATVTSPIGDYPVTCSGAADANYIFTYEQGGLTIVKADLLITAPEVHTVYGGSVPGLEPTYDIPVNGDTALVVPPVCSTTAVVGSPVGVYPVTCVGAADPNYNISTVAGSVTVTKAPLQVTSVAASFVYGSGVPALTPKFVGLVNGDTAVAMPPRCSTTARSSSPVGVYAVMCTGAADPNYSVSVVPGSVTVTKAPLTLTASSGSRMYGVANPAFSFAVSGLVAGDAASVVSASVTSSAVLSSHPGAYAVTITNARATNYAFTLVAGSLTVTPAPLTVTAPSPHLVYGHSLPMLVPVFVGLMNGDRGTLTRPTCTTTATKSSAVGAYPSTCVGAADVNYAITNVVGTATVTPAPLTVTAAKVTRRFGSANPALNATFSGLVNGDSALVVPPVCSTTAVVGSPVGVYPVTCVGAADPNYTISTVAGSVTVTKAPLQVTSVAASFVYGSGVPALTPKFVGLVNGDTAVATLPTCSTTARSSSPVGVYAVMCTGAADPNYSVSVVPGSVTVTKAPLTLTASSGSRMYGVANPAFVFAVSGLVAGDAASVVSASVTSSAVLSSHPGAYAVTITNARATNYAFTLVAGSLTVTPAPLTVTGPNVTRKVGAANPTLTATFSGLVNGDRGLATPPRCSTTASVSSPTGTYPVTCTGAADQNYTIVTVAGSVTVIK